MPNAAVIQHLLLPLTAGFLLLYLSLPRRFKLHQLDHGKYAVYLLALSVELYLLCLLGSIALSYWLCGNPAWPKECIPHELIDLGDAFPESFRPVPLFTVPVAILVALLENLFTAVRSDAAIVKKALRIPPWWRAPILNVRASALAAYMRDCNDARQMTVYRSQILGKALLVTLKSRKVYVGIPNIALDPTIEHRFIRLLPIASGVRDEKDAKVSLTTFYDRVSAALQEAQSAAGPLAASTSLVTFGTASATIDTNDIGTLIAWDEIESLFIWDPGLFRLFNADATDISRAVRPLWERLVLAIMDKN